MFVKALTPCEEGTDMPAVGPQAFRTVSCEVALRFSPYSLTAFLWSGRRRFTEDSLKLEREGVILMAVPSAFCHNPLGASDTLPGLTLSS
jgi:hypothetical protein